MNNYDNETIAETAARCHLILGEINSVLDKKDVTLDKILDHLGVDTARINMKLGGL